MIPSRHLQLGPGRHVRVHWTFVNRQPTETALWVALCPSDAGQAIGERRLVVHEGVEGPSRERTDGNELRRIDLAPGGVVTLEAAIRTRARRLVDGPDRAPLEGGSPTAFRHGTPMVPVDDAIRDSATRVVDARRRGDPEDPVVRARAFFDELVHGPYGYVHPPAERGAAAMLRDGRGDCGEFSALFAAWCRASGIPARVVYGTWAHGRNDAHAWNEFWLDDAGWVPVDASLGWSMRHRPWNWLGQGLPLNADAFFARLDAARVAFSYGPDVEPDAEYPAVDAAVAGAATKVRVAGKDLPWGAGALHGRLPYLQPAYPRFTSPPRTDQELLGTWTARELGGLGRLELVRRVAMSAAGVAGPLFLMAGIAGLATSLERVALVVLLVAGLAYLAASLSTAALRRFTRAGVPRPAVVPSAPAGAAGRTAGERTSRAPGR